MSVRDDLASIFHAGIDACHPRNVVPPHLPVPPRGRTILLALGKAAVPMAEAVEEGWKGPLSGLAVAPRGSAGHLRLIDRLESGHPIPDQSSVAAAEHLLRLAREAGPDDLVLMLLSGGASALACLPGEGLSLSDKQAITGALLRSGAPIADINCVRRHLSRFKGGGLARAARSARLVTLAISDVVGDDPQDIGSGPTVADVTTITDAKAVLAKYGIPVPATAWSETVKPEEAATWNADYRIIARGRDAVEAASARARQLGWMPRIIDSDGQGDARAVARAHARLALNAAPGTALISGGELTVTVTGSSQGGPNREYALALALALDSAPVHALAADTDGIDGAGDAAGAFVDPTTLARAKTLGLDPARTLSDHDSGVFFAALGDSFISGPTGTNVNDLRILLVEP